MGYPPCQAFLRWRKFSHQREVIFITWEIVNCKPPDGLIDYHWKQETEEYDRDYVNPTNWTVAFDACGTVPAPGELRWDIDGQTLSETTCSFSHDFKELKSYVVSLTVTTKCSTGRQNRMLCLLHDGHRCRGYINIEAYPAW